MPTDRTGVSAGNVAEVAVVKPPKPFDFTKYEEWPRWLKGSDLRAIQRLLRITVIIALKTNKKSKLKKKKAKGYLARKNLRS